MTRRIVTLAMVAVSLALAACNTVRGVGEDLKSAADAVDEQT
ncbi:MAG: hypothetical protein ACT4N8_00440 [Sphingosinicella sp.]